MRIYAILLATELLSLRGAKVR